MNNGLGFKGFYVSAKEDPNVYNGVTYYKVELSDGDHLYQHVNVGSDQVGKACYDDLVEFDVLYDGILSYNRGKLSLVSHKLSDLKDPVLGLMIEGIRCSAIPQYESVSKDGDIRYSATFSDGKKSFSILLGSNDEGKQLRDNLQIRKIYSGSVIYISTEKGNFLLARELRPLKADKNK